ncbi:NEL-type E3 ubiquitin ligase domain-containing protein [Pseudomonas xanthosomatis]|uniref:NEL-type E3 ubiquitin ligase domain-containing protein n=1 Tax=Pseudomonas xanthosomatis TaxID=2842356 RepID=UPI0035193CC2
MNLSRNQISHVPDLDGLTTRPFIEALLRPTHNEQWRFSFNPVDEPTRRELRSAGVVIERPPAQEPLQPGERPRNWLQPNNQAQRDLWDSLFADSANHSLHEVMEQAGLSSAAHSNSPALTRQIWRLLQEAADSSELRARLEEVAQSFPVSCGDAGADALGTLQIEARVFQMTAGRPQVNNELFGYFRRLYRRDQVNEIAQQIYSARLNRRTGLLAERSREALPPAQRGVRPGATPGGRGTGHCAA